MARRTGFHKKFKFVVEERGFAVANFAKASELSVELGKVEYREGGHLLPDRSPGFLNYADITLERGVTFEPDLYNWMQETADAAQGLGSGEAIIRRTLDLVQLDRDNVELRRWRIHDAWPVKFVAGEWDSEAEENVIESITLTFDYFEQIQ